MCDYSAESVKRRDAAVGDKLVTAKISGHTTGLMSPADATTAVCMLPGATLIVADIPSELQQRFGVGAVAQATFAQKHIPAGQADCRDGITFGGGVGGKFILFQDLPIGMEMTVEQIPGKTIDESAPAREERHALAV